MMSQTDRRNTGGTFVILKSFEIVSHLTGKKVLKVLLGFSPLALKKNFYRNSFDIGLGLGIGSFQSLGSGVESQFREGHWSGLRSLVRVGESFMNVEVVGCCESRRLQVQTSSSPSSSSPLPLPSLSSLSS